MARVNKDHTVSPATHTLIHKWNEPCLHLLPSHRASQPFGRYRFPIPLKVGGWIGLCGWLHTETVYPWNEMVTHLSTNLAWCRVTWLMPNNVTIMPYPPPRQHCKHWKTTNHCCQSRMLLHGQKTYALCSEVKTTWSINLLGLAYLALNGM